MKSRLQDWQRSEKRRASLLIALAVHAIAITVFATMHFHYELESFFGLTRDSVESVAYIATPRAKPVASAPAARDKNSGAAVASVRLIAPPNIPSTLPPLPKPSAAVGLDANTPMGSRTRNPLTVGVVPAQPDERIVLDPRAYDFPKTPQQRTDSAIKAMLMQWHDSVIATQLAKGRDPRDWTVDRDGQKWGWDPEGIHLGKFMIPNALLAALPMNIGGGVDPERLRESRQADYIRQDILLHQSAMSEEDMNKAIKRIRERKDKEKAEAEKAKAIAAGKGGDNP